MRRFSSIDPVGILKAWTTNVRMKSARTTAMTIDSKYSRRIDFLKLSAMLALGLGAHLQNREERFLRDLDLADALHPLLAFLLFLEELAFARDVAAVALGEHVLAHRLDRFARDDAAADRGLNSHLEHLTPNQLPHLRRQRRPAVVGSVSVHADP